MAQDGDEAGPRAFIRFVDEHSGRNDMLGAVASFAAMANVVARRLEAERPGSRFPLLRTVGRRQPLVASECEALAREVARLRAALAGLGVDDLRPPSTSADVPPPTEIFRRLNGDGVPRTLAEAFAWPLFVLEHIARLGAASRRGARFEVGDAEVFAAGRTPLNPHEALDEIATARERPS